MLKERSFHAERMDDLNLGGNELKQTLKGLAIINTLLGNTSATFKAVKKIIKQNPTQTLKIIDLGCGGGDNLRKIASWCFKNKHSVNLVGIDGNASVLSYANEKNENSVPIVYQQADILNPSFELETCDVLISSHFMYHFKDEALIDFLKKAKNKVQLAIIFSDLYRSDTAYLLFKYAGFLMPFHSTVKKDGLKAIARSFKKEELQAILQKATLKSYALKYKWIFRYLLIVKL